MNEGSHEQSNIEVCPQKKERKSEWWDTYSLSGAF
jgi:hypothetical protein